MPSPFPGMNPFLEKPSDWHDFHGDFLVRVRAQLASQIRPAFIAKTEDRVYLHELSAEERLEAREMLAGIGDVVLKRRSGDTAPAAFRPGAAAVAEPSARCRLEPMAVEEIRESYIQLLDRQTREVVTVIELLSPTNKRNGSDRTQFQAKRARLLTSTVNYVEIDLLRGGPPMPLDEEPPPGVYRVVVSRGDRADPPGPWPSRPPADVWVWNLRDPLPVIPIPLRPPHPEAALDLRAALDRTYDEAGLEDYLHLTPPDPPLDPADAAWAADVLAAAAPRGPQNGPPPGDAS